MALAAEESAIDAVRVVLHAGRTLGQGDNEVTGDPVRALIGFVLVDNLGIAGGTSLNLEADLGGLLLDTLSITCGTPVLDGLATTATGVAAHLHLLEHTGGELLLDDTHTMTTAGRTSIDLAVGAACTLTGLANVLALPLKLGGGAIVEVTKGDLDTDLDIVATRLAGVTAEVSVAAEETAEHIEGIVAAATAVLMVLDTLVAVAVVDLTGLGVAQDAVGLGDLDELVMSGGIATESGLVCGQGDGGG